VKSKELKTGYDLAESSMEGCGQKGCFFDDDGSPVLTVILNRKSFDFTEKI
jgi:hypothetical protein